MKVENYGLLLMVFLPIISGSVGFYLGKKNKTTRNDWLDLVLIAELAMHGYFIYQLVANQKVMQLTLSDRLGLEFSFVLDGVRLMLCLLATVIFGVGVQFMKESLSEKQGSNRFFLLYMGMYSMVLGAFMTTGFLDLLIFITFAALLAWPMMMHRRDKQELKNAGIYMGFLLSAVAVIQVGLVYVYVSIGHVEYLGIYSNILLNGVRGSAVAGGFLMAVGFAVFSGVFPVQHMITKGSAYGLMEGSAVFTSLLSKLGVYGMMLLACNLFGSIPLFGKALLIVGLLTMIWGIFTALIATDIRKILVGINVAANGFHTLAVSFVVLCREKNGYAVCSSLYMLVVSALSLFVLYMVALEQVKKVGTYEIKGLIASGKGNTLLAAGCFFACVSLAGLPGTAGYLSYSLLFQTIYWNIGWKWLTVLYIVLWAFFMTAISRIFMKLFVSKKDETIRILTTKTESVEEESMDAKEGKRSYRPAEIMLLLVGLVQVMVGIWPGMTFDKMTTAITEFFRGESMEGVISYYTGGPLIAFGIAVGLCIIIYVNLVHGILLRAARDKKHKELQEQNNKNGMY